MKKTILTVLLFIAAQVVFAQYFADEIAAFKIQDSISKPPQNAILFIGSSSFRLWKNVQNDFKGYTIINRGFGGSTLPDVIQYAGDIILPYHPKQVVIYCGENDFASSDAVTAAMLLKRFKVLYHFIRKHYKTIPIAFVSIKPSPSRWHLAKKMVEANRLIKEYLKSKRKTAYIDVYNKMLQPDATVMNDIFIADKLHMNAKGYAIWQKEIEPFLLKD